MGYSRRLERHRCPVQTCPRRLAGLHWRPDSRRLASLRKAMADLGETRIKSIRRSQSISSSTTRSKSMHTVLPVRSRKTWTSSSNVTKNAISSFVGHRQHSITNRAVPPATGIVSTKSTWNIWHRVVLEKQDGDGNVVYPDSLVGTDSHTTMINGLGVLGWGVGGIEAEASMLGQPSYFPVPEVVGVKIVGKSTQVSQRQTLRSS